MSLDDTANKSETARKQGFFGYTLENGKRISSQKMLEIHENYETMLKNGEYQGVRDLEKTNNYPKTWLNYQISGLIKNTNNGLAKKLVQEFKGRGF